MNRPPLAVLSLAVGAFLSAVLGGRLPTDTAVLGKEESLAGSLFGSAPFTGHVLIFLFFLVPMISAIFGRKVVHVPNIRISAFLAALAGFLGLSLVWSSFLSVSLVYFLEFAMMIGSFYAVTGNSGKKQGVVVLYGWFTGIAVSAMMGLREYSEMKLIDPSWRIFADQLSPNQAGSLFASGIVLGIALAFGADRLPRLLIAIGILLQGLALFLTQSKGALVCLPIGILVLAVLLLALKSSKPATVFAVIGASLVLLAALAFAAQTAGKIQAQSPSGAAPMSRFANASESAVQSAGFRKLLWISALELSKERVQGWGLGTFQYESTRPGRVTQTVLAHQSYLQLAAEATWFAPIAFLGFITMVVARGLKGARQLPLASRLSIASAVAAIAVQLAHNAIDSDLYVANLGLLVFTLCGVICASSADSQSPEVIFRVPKIATASALVLFGVLSLVVGASEVLRLGSRSALAAGNQLAAKDSAQSAISLNPIDGSAYALLARNTGSTTSMQTAASLAPSPKNYRALASMLLREGKYPEAESAYFKALQRDPNNALALFSLMKAAIDNNQIPRAVEVAQRLIATESSTYYTVRSQPEFIPTQTFHARLFLATQPEQDKPKLLEEAIKGFAQYRDTTVPVVKRALKADPNANVAGEDASTVIDNLTKAAEACRELAKLQPRRGDFDPAVEATRFEEAASGLIK